jgi:hypothetical protein
MSNYCLGRLPVREGDPRLMLFKYLKASQLPTLPASTAWRDSVAVWPMLKNDTYGDCVPAGMLHAAQLMTALASTEYVPTDSDAITVYEAVGHFDPANPSATDRGCNMFDVASYMVNTGVLGVKLDACPSIDYRDLDNLRQVINLFAACPIGVMLPKNAQAQFELGEPWDTTFFPQLIEGGHCVDLVDYDADYFYAVTWGKVQKVTPRWLAKYCEEAFAPLSRQLWLPGGEAPNTFDYDQLLTDLNSIPTY